MCVKTEMYIGLQQAYHCPEPLHSSADKLKLESLAHCRIGLGGNESNTTLLRIQLIAPCQGIHSLLLRAACMDVLTCGLHAHWGAFKAM